MNLLEKLIGAENAEKCLDEIAIRCMPSLSYHDVSHEARMDFAKRIEGFFSDVRFAVLEQSIGASNLNGDAIGDILDEWIANDLIKIFESRESITELTELLAVVCAIDLSMRTQEKE